MLDLIKLDQGCVDISINRYQDIATVIMKITVLALLAILAPDRILINLLRRADGEMTDSD